MVKYLGILFLLFLMACGPTPQYSESIALDPVGWMDETATFQLSIADIEPRYELQLVIDHATSYRYQNIYFKIRTTFPDREPREEQLTVNLADKKGTWQGDCSAEACETRVYLLESFKFPAGGEYTFELIQYTRDETLAGVNGLELNLFKLKEE